MVDCLGFGEVKSKKFYAALLAEFLGTMFLVIGACGSALAPAKNGCVGGEAFSGTTVQISLGFSFSVATMVWATAHVSGGHINPAVTFGFLVARKISIVRCLLYVAMQTLGAVTGAGLLKLLTKKAGSIGTSTLGNGTSAGQGFGVELLLTFVLVFTVFSAVDGGRTDIGGSVPLTIGFAIAMGHLWAVPFTGAGMNPARVFGPALVSGTWDDHWLYWLGPLAGGAIAAILYEFVFAVNATPTKLKGFFSRDYDDGNYDNHGRRLPISSSTEMKA